MELKTFQFFSYVLNRIEKYFNKTMFCREARKKHWSKKTKLIFKSWKIQTCQKTKKCQQNSFDFFRIKFDCSIYFFNYLIVAVFFIIIDIFNTIQISMKIAHENSCRVVGLSVDWINKDKKNYYIMGYRVGSHLNFHIYSLTSSLNFYTYFF